MRMSADPIPCTPRDHTLYSKIVNYVDVPISSRTWTVGQIVKENIAKQTGETNVLYRIAASPLENSNIYAWIAGSGRIAFYSNAAQTVGITCRIWYIKG